MRQRLAESDREVMPARKAHRCPTPALFAPLPLSRLTRVQAAGLRGELSAGREVEARLVASESEAHARTHTHMLERCPHMCADSPWSGLG